MSKKNARIKKLRAEVAQLKKDLNEVLDNPRGGRANQLRLLRLMQRDVLERIWLGYPSRMIPPLPPTKFTVI